MSGPHISLGHWVMVCDHGTAPAAKSHLWFSAASQKALTRTVVVDVRIKRKRRKMNGQIVE